MNEASIREGVRRHYGDQSLSGPQQERLTRLLRRNQGPGRRGFLFAAAAIVILAVGAVLVLTHRSAEERSHELALAVAKEIARNHTKHPEVDLESTGYGGLREGLTRLDFTLLESRDPALAGLRLTGARYCSLQGHVAAQLRLEDAEGRRLTLYQARDAETFRALVRETVRVGGLEVDVWRESGVILGLARPAR